MSRVVIGLAGSKERCTVYCRVAQIGQVVLLDHVFRDHSTADQQQCVGGPRTDSLGDNY